MWNEGHDVLARTLKIDWRTWHSPLIHLPPPSAIHLPAPAREIHQCRRELEQIFNYAINCWGGFSLHQLLFFLLVRFLHFVFLLVSVRVSSLHALRFVIVAISAAVAALLCSLILQWNLCAMSKVQRSVGRTHTHASRHVGACIKRTHTLTHSHTTIKHTEIKEENKTASSSISSSTNNNHKHALFSTQWPKHRPQAESEEEESSTANTES